MQAKWYTITDADMNEFISMCPPYSKPNRISLCDALQSLMYKTKKWGPSNIKFVGELIENKGMACALYHLFHEKARHPLYIKHFPVVPDMESSLAVYHKRKQEKERELMVFGSGKSEAQKYLDTLLTREGVTIKYPTEG